MDTSTEPKFDPSLEEPTNTPPVPVPKVDDSPNAGGLLDQAGAVGADIIKGVVAGGEGAVAGVRKTARGIADATGLSDLVGDRETNAQPLETKSEAPEGAAGKIAASFTQAALGYAVGAVALRSVSMGPILGSMAQSAVGTPLVVNPDQERLSNVLMQYPWLAPIVEPLAQNPTDSVLTSKVKAGLEDVLTTGAAAVVFKGAQLLYMKATGKASPAVIAKAESELSKASSEAESSTSGTAHLLGPDEKPLNLSNPKLSNGLSGFKQLNLDELKVIDSMHPDEVNLSKVQTIRDAIRTGKSGQFPPIDVEHSPQGGYNVVDGRHRLLAAREEGYTSITANVEKVFDKKLQLSPEMQAKYATKPITLTTHNGEPIVTLTPAKQAKFEQIMDELVIKDAVEGTPALEAGAVKGSMNPAHATGPNNVLQSLKELGDLTKRELNSKTPGYRSVDESRALASIMGQDHAELIANVKSINAALGDNSDAVFIGARQLLQTKGMEMFELGKKATFSGDQEAADLFAEKYLQLAEFNANFSQLTTKLGRGLRTFGEDVGPFDPAKVKAMFADPEQAKNIQRLITATEGDVDKIAHILKAQQLSLGAKLLGAHNEYWTGLGLLSRLATQTVNMTSTAINSLMEPASMIVGGVERGLTGHGWREAREGVAIYSGMRTAFFDSMHMAWQAAKTESSIISQAGTLEQPTKYISALTFNMNPNSFAGKFIDHMGTLTRLSFRGLTAGDEFFKQLSYRAKVSAHASLDAIDMVKAGTMAKDEIVPFVAKALQDSIDEQGRGIIPEALKYAEKASFVNDLKGATIFDLPSMGEMMARLSGQHPVIRGVILPFVKTPTNVTRTTFEYTPLIGQLRKQFYTDVAAGGEKQAMALGKLTIGAGMYVGAGMLALEGRITGAPPAPGVMVPKGWKPYSVVLHGMGEDGGDLYISYQRMQPFGDILGLTADFAKSTGMLDVDTREGLANSMSLALGKLMTADSEHVANAGLSAASAYGKSLISKTYYRNMTEFFSTMSGYNNENAILRWLQNYSASHVPGVLSQFNSDDTVREVRSTLDAIMARIPGLSQQLPANRDYFGNINDTKVGFGWSIIQPLAVSETKVDPVMSELQRLSKSNAQTKFSEPEHLMTVAGKKVDLKLVKNSDGQTAYDVMREHMQTVKPAGEHLNFHDKLESIMAGPRYKRGTESDVLDGSPLSPGIRQNLIKVEEAKYRDAALTATKNQFKNELGITSALNDKIQTQVGRKKVGAGLYDKILNLNE